jgi:hypothetical protein
MTRNYELCEDEFIPSSAIRSYISKSKLYNNILWGNESSYFEQTQIFQAKSYYMKANNVQNQDLGNYNTQHNPEFVNVDEDDFSLTENSPLIDRGFNDFDYQLPDLDIQGNNRVIDGNGDDAAYIDVGAFERSSVDIEENIVSYDSGIKVYPNPFVKKGRNTEIKLQFSMNYDSNVTASVYNTKGQRVTTIYSGYLKNGNHELSWNGTSSSKTPSANGIYFIRIETNKETKLKKFLMLK